MARVFVSYRRKDSGLAVDAIMLELERVYGRKNVFRDIGAIKPGDLFPEVIRRRMKESDAVLAVIGPNYLSAENADRLMRPDDSVRLELEMALARGTPVLPVTVEGARMPSKGQLPPTLATVADTNALEVRQGRSFQQDLGELVSELRRITRPRRVERLTRLGSVAAACVLSASAGFGVCAKFGPAREVEIPGTVREVHVPGPVKKVRVPRPADSIRILAEARDDGGQVIDEGGWGTYSLWIEGPEGVLDKIKRVKYIFDDPSISIHTLNAENEKKENPNFKSFYENARGSLSYVTAVIRYQDDSLDALSFNMKRAVRESARKAHSR